MVQTFVNFLKEQKMVRVVIMGGQVLVNQLIQNI